MVIKVFLFLKRLSTRDIFLSSPAKNRDTGGEVTAAVKVVRCYGTFSLPEGYLMALDFVFRGDKLSSSYGPV